MAMLANKARSSRHESKPREGLMSAAVTPAYGAPSVLERRELPVPTCAARDVLVEIHATAVTAGDLRMRAADFPSFSAVPGRLMLGLRRPRRAVQGTVFAGRVVARGGDATRYAVGDDVFGIALDGAYAEYLCMAEDGPMAKLPANVGFEEAAAVPYGAVTALRFLREVGALARGEKLLVVGGAGGVGRFAVQLAKHLGAEVTAVASRRSFDLVRSLGADHVIDRESEDFTRSEQRYDVIFDTAGVTTFGGCRASLTRNGRYLTLFLSVGVLIRMAITALGGGPKAKFTVAIPDRELMEEVRDLVASGIVRPIIARRYPLERIAEAHAEAESGHPQGSVIVTVGRAMGQS